jgi:hypothetical protein
MTDAPEVIEDTTEDVMAEDEQHGSVVVKAVRSNIFDMVLYFPLKVSDAEKHQAIMEKMSIKQIGLIHIGLQMLNENIGNMPPEILEMKNIVGDLVGVFNGMEKEILDNMASQKAQSH